MSNQEREIMSNIKFDKNNIEEMEKQINKFSVSINNHESWRLSGILENMLDQHKDHIEKIAKLENMLRTLMKKEDKELLNENDNYPYEPNE